MPCWPRATTSTGFVAFKEPAHQVDVIGQHVQHRRGVRITLENLEGLRARVVDAGEAADDRAEAALHHLLFGAQKTFLIAAAVAEVEFAFGFGQRVQNIVSGL